MDLLETLTNGGDFGVFGLKTALFLEDVGVYESNYVDVSLFAVGKSTRFSAFWGRQIEKMSCNPATHQPGCLQFVFFVEFIYTPCLTIPKDPFVCPKNPGFPRSQPIL